MKKPDYTNDSQQRILKTLLILFGHEIDGLPPGQIARLVGATASNATRDLFNLEKAGMAERLSHNDNYRISPLIAQKAMSVLVALDRAEQKITETRQRFTRT
ncbi:MAG: IclR family transcriptional regulator [Burkholderiaceae bacterium]|jgi:DNA-binding MarR family transcriptional regulator|nr:IclR family transcriptional regulator [Burkholderiaceae bacterium]